MNEAEVEPNMIAIASVPHNMRKPNFVGRIRAKLLFSLLTLFSLNAQYSWALPGDLDSSFGGAFGRYFINTVVGGVDSVSAIARQTDGKLILVGPCGDSNQPIFCIARRNVDGSADTSFAANNGNTSGVQFIVVAAPGDRPSSVVVDPDGKIVVGGTCTAFNIRSFCMVRLTPAGFTDPTFGSSGRVNQIVGAGDARVTSLLRQADGKYVLAGSCFDGNRNTLCAARFLPTGAFDQSFGIQGRRIVPVSSEAFGYAAALQSDGRILIAGSCNAGTSMCVARLTAAGTVDGSFAQENDEFPSNGIAIASNGGNDTANGIAIQADGKIVLGGSCPQNNQPAFCTTRLNANGFSDSDFGVFGALDRIARFTLGSTNAIASAVALQNDGRILLVGSCVGANSDFCLLRLNDNGSADQSFGSFGVVKTNVVDAADFALTTLVQPDGKIVVAGQCSESFAPTDAAMCIARYEGGPFGARNCSFDLDGDGVVLGTTDQLILSRIARGVKNANAIGGVSFAAHATRKTWDSIRSFLVTQCGIALP
jgi:uncharacterized delta-60 repeat protein